MAEQHSTPEQAAAGKCHGGLGGGYKVRASGEGSRGALDPGLPVVLGASLPARQPLSRKQQQPFLPARSKRASPFSAYSCLFCVLVCTGDLVTPTLPVSTGLSGDTGADPPALAQSSPWASLDLSSSTFNLGTAPTLLREVKLRCHYHGWQTEKSESWRLWALSALSKLSRGFKVGSQDGLTKEISGVFDQTGGTGRARAAQRLAWLCT